MGFAYFNQFIENLAQMMYCLLTNWLMNEWPVMLSSFNNAEQVQLCGLGGDFLVKFHGSGTKFSFNII